MGSSGGGGGSAGEVSWPADVQTRYNNLLSTFDGATYTSFSNASASLQTAQTENPYPGTGAYSPTSEVSEILNDITTFHQASLEYEPFAKWEQVFGQAFERYNSITGSAPLFIRAEPNAWVDIGDIWLYVTNVLNAATDIADGWVDPEFDAPTDIKTDLANESQVDASTTAHRAVLNDQLLSDVLPRFEAGMRDINAVQSSAFVIGQAIIEGMGDRDVAKFDADLRYKAFLQRDSLLGQAHMQIDKLNAINTDEYNKATSGAHLQDDKLQAAELAALDQLRAQALIQSDKINADSNKAESLINAEMTRHKTTMIYQDTDALFKNSWQFLDLYKAWAAFSVDANRITYVMNKEYNDKNLSYDAASARWDLDMVQIAGNLIASISGGTSYTAPPTDAQNALGGAFAGASIGARASGGSLGGTAAGALLGGIGAYLMG